jgi:hypothetical protein
MEEYKHNIFYNPEPVVKFLDEFKKEVQERAYLITLEEKYKKGVSKRQKTKKSLRWILDLCKRKEDIRIVHVMPNYGQKERLQIVFMYDWYFAWCDLELEHLEYFFQKYKLKNLTP